MATIDLATLFPEPMRPELVRGPLPKQAEFMHSALNPKGPKNLAYFGGYGSGKSLILCITMIAMGVIYGGEYVIARQYMPELRRTTMKLFQELLPKKLLLELRVADAEIHIKSAKGKAVFYFVGLDSPEKLDSLTLDGAAIDEASQTTKEAFLKLMGRCRGLKGLRKILLVGNPRGHDYVYEYFIKQDSIKPEIRHQFKLIVAPSLENIHLTSDYIESMLSTYSPERIQRDVMGSFDVFEGMVFSEFRRDVHIIDPIDIPEEWTKVIGVDHGWNNPAAWVYAAINYDGDIYVYHEYYKTETLIKDICRENLRYIGKNYKKLQGVYIDPSTRATRGQTGLSDFDSYIENIPKDFPLILAQNDVESGLDRIKSYLKIRAGINRPKLYIFKTCSNLIEELTQYRYEELGPGREGKQNLKETPRKYKDHAVDALRYLVMSQPEPPKKKTEKQQLLDKFPIYKEMESLRNPIPKDPFGDMI